MDLNIRAAVKADEPILWQMLYHALYVPEGKPAPPKEIVRQPDIARYVEGWGCEHDSGCIACEALAGSAIGAAWLRLWSPDNHGYGYLCDSVPELSIAVIPGFRSCGVGTRLLRRLLQEADRSYASVSLSVTADNPAVRLYLRFGFTRVEAKDGALLMQRDRGSWPEESMSDNRQAVAEEREKEGRG